LNKKLNKNMKLEIIALKGKVYEAEISSVSLPALAGEISVLPNHMPLFSLLKDGKIKVARKENAEEKIDYLKITGGFAEVKPNEVIIMANDLEFIKEN